MCDKTVSHPPGERLLEYGLGKLDPDEAHDVEAHIAECDHCCQTLINLQDDTFGRTKGVRNVSATGNAIRFLTPFPARRPPLSFGRHLQKRGVVTLFAEQRATDISPVQCVENQSSRSISRAAWHVASILRLRHVVK